MTLRTKVLLAQAPLAVALLVLGLVAVRTLSVLGSASEAILKDNYRSVVALQRMKESAERIDSAALFLLLGRADQAVPQLTQHRERFERELRVQEGNITEPGEEQATRELRARWEAYKAALEDFQRAAPRPEPAVYFDELGPLFLQLKGAADAILDLNQQAMVAKSDRARALARRRESLTWATLAAALVVGMLASARLTARLLQPVSVLSLAARRIGEQDFTARARIEGEDELARLAQDFNAMAERLQRYEESALGRLVNAQQASHAAIGSLPDPVMVLDLEGRLVGSNAAAEALFRLDGAADMDVLQRLDAAVRPAVEKVRAHVLAGRGPYVPRGFEEAVRVSSGEGDRFLLARASPIYDPDMGITGVTVVLQDITRLRRFDQLKSDLVATVAHEFRTPLTSLRMAVHLCLEGAAGPLSEKQADLLSAAREDCERLQAMVDDLLDLSRIEGGVLQVRRRVVPVADLVEAAAERHLTEARERGVTLRRALPADLGWVQADPDRVNLVLGNLIANAVQHTPPGGTVTVGAHMEEEVVAFEVTDTGEGIPPEYHQQIFEKFYRIPGSASRGAGFGLFVSREIVRAHGSDLTVESAPGRGSVFRFSLPAVADPAEPVLARA